MYEPPPRVEGAVSVKHSGEKPNGNGGGKRKAEPRIKLIAFDDIVLGTARRDLVKGFIPRVGLTVVWGPPKCGKSFWAFDVVLHCALGWPYRERRVHQGAVVYCAFEGQTGIAARVEAFRKRFLSSHRDPVPFYLEPVTLDLVAERDALLAAIRVKLGEVQPVAVVLDTLNRSLRGSESKDEDMGAYVRAADAIREAFECAVIIVHHCGIEGTRPRGHTGLTGAADAQIAVKRDDADTIIATVEFMKDGPQDDQIASQLEVVEVGTDEDGETITSCVVVAGEVSPQAKAVKVKGAAKLALDLLKQALVDDGMIGPGSSDHIPPNTRTTSCNLWRRYCDAGTVAESDNPDNKRRAFVRISKKLQELGIISIWNDRVWLAGQAGQ